MFATEIRFSRINSVTGLLFWFFGIVSNPTWTGVELVNLGSVAGIGISDCRGSGYNSQRHSHGLRRDSPFGELRIGASHLGKFTLGNLVPGVLQCKSTYLRVMGISRAKTSR
jgi:hypothetical protein